MMPRLCSITVAVSLLGCAHAPSTPPGPHGERLLWVEGGAGKLRVSDGGAGGPAVVLVHGLGSNRESWRAQLDHLRGAGRRAVAYDQRGHGESDRARDGVYTVDALAEDLDAVVRALGLRRIVLVGHSFSGTVITAYAAAHPDTVAGLVYVDAVGDFTVLPPEAAAEMAKEDASLDAAGLRAAYEEMLGPLAGPATRERVLKSVGQLDPPAFAALRHSMATFPGRARYAAYHGPAVAIETSEPFPVRASPALGLERVEVSGVSHWLMLDDPDATNRALDAFVAKLP